MKKLNDTLWGRSLVLTGWTIVLVSSFYAFPVIVAIFKDTISRNFY